MRIKKSGNFEEEMKKIRNSKEGKKAEKENA